MSSAAAKSGPSGITILKSRMFTNWTAPTQNTTARSEVGPAILGAAYNLAADAKAR